jgi:predicted nucleic acid-binding protein
MLLIRSSLSKRLFFNRRDYPLERSKVVAEIASVWSQITAIAAPLELNIDSQTTNAALGRLATQLIDGYDLFILETIKKHSVTQIITDDGDYVTITIVPYSPAAASRSK